MNVATVLFTVMHNLICIAAEILIEDRGSYALCMIKVQVQVSGSMLMPNQLLKYVRILLRVCLRLASHDDWSHCRCGPRCGCTGCDRV